ncbi:STAS domain-containing protein [Massilia sp. Root335]|uniref:STAS domain-containing protein n=1 Tax=Massilia sp. Root335 TaxID=1736517 RepID=UPI0006F64014|nr:STAS domain-containing protein [Massilia sp. Root335]
MGLFDFLKKKGDAPLAGAAARPRHDNPLAAGPVTRLALDTEAERERQREIARATAAKIDEIELEMTSAIFDDDAWSGIRRPPAAGSPQADQNTDFLLGPDDLPDAAAAPSSALVVEEAAILYANDQLDAAALLLRTSVRDSNGGAGERLPWWMLFDLYQIMGLGREFESIAIDYASHFETSPPTYHPFAETSRSLAGPALDDQFSGAIPTASLSGRLDDGDGARAQLARAQAASPSPLVRFEFQAITQVTPPGCALLLEALQALRKAGRELVLAGADQLVAVLRPMLAIGDRGAGEAPWLLLLELLLLTNREKDFEETAMDYCVTFEVSPPSFEAPPQLAVSLAAASLPPHVAQGAAAPSDRFLLPAVIRGSSAALLAAIADHVADRPALVLDGSRLARIDYAAASALAVHLRTLAQDGRDVVLRDLNHLVAALLRLLGVGDRVRLYAHKY